VLDSRDELKASLSGLVQDLQDSDEEVGQCSSNTVTERLRQ
jgi:hypothetical protein